MRVAPLATLVALIVTSSAAAQTVRPAATAVPSRLTTVHAVLPRLRFVSEGNRLGRSGALDSLAARRLLDAEVVKSGMAIGTEANADAQLDAIFVCAGPDAGPVGCSVELHLMSVDRSGGTIQPGYQIWASERSLFRRAGWAEMAKAVPAMVSEIASELTQASAVSNTRLSLGGAPSPR
jgi:hypothetical protein